METIELQLQFVVATFLGGIGIMACYSVLRLLRFFVPHKKIMVCVEDYLFWSLASIPCFCVFFFGNEGSLRWYGILAMLLGGIVYEAVIYRKIVLRICRGFSKITKKFKKI